MYAGIDIGGTKTLVAVLDEHGVIKEQLKFPTPHIYEDFIEELTKTAKSLEHQDYTAAGVAIPGLLDRDKGQVISLGNLPWQNEAIKSDCEKILRCPVVIENDANTAGLSEAMLHKDAETVLYVTVSTGIGTAVVRNQQLDPALLNSEGGHLLLPYHDQLKPWESFASGKAIYEHFGKKASDITDAADWKYIVHNLGLGLFEHISLIQPDLIIIGGSIGTYFDRYGKLLAEELKHYELPIVPIPQIIAAERPEEAVVYGCYDLAKQTYGHATNTH